MKKYHIQAFSLPKDGCSIEEYEDAFCFNENTLTFAISDGATEATFSKIWAEILVENFVYNPVEAISDDWLQGCHKSFAESLLGRNLPWHAEIKLNSQGSFATLATLQIDPESSTFEFSAIGDSCVFWHDSIGFSSFPYRSTEEFLNRPYLLCSKTGFNNEAIQNQSFDIRNLSASMKFYMATDALSCWILDSCQKGEEPWHLLDALTDENDFFNFISDLRVKGTIKNDDVTLINIKEIFC